MLTDIFAVSSLSAIFLLLWGVSILQLFCWLSSPLAHIVDFQIASFRDISLDKQHAPKLQTFDIVLGTLYLVSCVIEALGIVAAVTVSLVPAHSFSCAF